MALPSWSWKLAESVSSTGFGCRAARLFEAAFEVATVALKATFLVGPEGYVWHCLLGAGSSLKRSARLHGFGCGATRLFEAATAALKATLLAGPEHYVWHCLLGAKSSLKLSAPLGLAVAQRGFLRLRPWH